jgi:FAD/FMN-containing dehydrogenase
LDSDTVNSGVRLTRRRTLGLLAGAAATVLGGCSAGSSAPPTTPRSARRPTSTAAPTQATGADWRRLGARLHGELRRPGQPGYRETAALYDPRFDHSHPAAVASVGSESDVAHCISFARRFNLPLAIRSGGHSYLGASTGRGLVIDLRGLNSVENDPGGATAVVGAGAALVDVYAALAADAVSIPAGSCPTVGISGLTLGGGVGVVGRQYGLTSDRLVAARVVTADGTTVQADRVNSSDLLWALRGGGGSFGVVTQLSIATHPTSALAHAYLAWPWSAAVAVTSAWQQWAPAAPHALWSTCHLLAPPARPGVPTVAVAAVYLGASADLDRHLDGLVANIPVSPTTRSVSSDDYETTMMLEAGCATQSVASCHLAGQTAGGTLPRGAFVAASDFFDHPIPPEGIAAAVQAVAARAADPALGPGGVALDVLGGAIDDLAPDATAYVHRGALFNAQYTASWGTAGGAGELGRNRRSLASVYRALHRFGNGQAYQNYPDPTLPDPLAAYYGSNLPRLVEVRRRYDPHGLFAQPQGVPLS